jgi:hypothetical protein
MNQQEIKANLPQLPLQSQDTHGRVLDHEGRHILTTETVDYNSTTDIAVDLAIVHAINNTYDKGINPESVPDMYNALHTISYYLHQCEEFEMYNIVKDILNKATL